MTDYNVMFMDEGPNGKQSSYITETGEYLVCIKLGWLQLQTLFYLSIIEAAIISNRNRK